MNKITKLNEEIDRTYDGNDYMALCDLHLNIINRYSSLWVSCKSILPEDGTWCFCIQDISPLKKGLFISDYYYTDEFGFTVNDVADDGYAFITHYITFDKIQESVL